MDFKARADKLRLYRLLPKRQPRKGGPGDFEWDLFCAVRDGDEDALRRLAKTGFHPVDIVALGALGDEATLDRLWRQSSEGTKRHQLAGLLLTILFPEHMDQIVESAQASLRARVRGDVSPRETHLPQEEE